MVALTLNQITMTKKLNPREQGLKELKDSIRNFYIGLPKWLQILIISLLILLVYELHIDLYKLCWQPSLVEWITGWDGFAYS